MLEYIATMVVASLYHLLGYDSMYRLLRIAERTHMTESGKTVSGRVLLVFHTNT